MKKNLFSLTILASLGIATIAVSQTGIRTIGSNVSQVVVSTPQPTSFQKKCGTISPNDVWDKWFNAQVETFKEELRSNKTSVATYQIPVIVHVIHGGQSLGTFPNISQAQVNSQIGILNNDFAGSGLNVGNYASTGFYSTNFKYRNFVLCCY